MFNRSSESLKKYILVQVFLLAAAAVIMGETALQPAVRELAQEAFEQTNPTAVQLFFERNIVRLAGPQAKCQALRLLAEYELHIGSYLEAADHYRQAAALHTEEETGLLLEAVRAFLCGGDFTSARSLLSRIAADIPVNDENAYYRTIAVYDAWRLLAEDHADRALPLISAYSKKDSFSDYHPSLLFTLWWVNGDEEAKQRLLKEFPFGMETAAVRGTITVQPSVFWYLMPKATVAAEAGSNTGTTKTAVSARAQNGETAAYNRQAQPNNTNGREERARPLYYQLGFYRTKAYAEALAADLRKKNFFPIIKDEKRPSGTVYFAVLVEDNAAGDMDLRLKDAGYEACPIFP